MEFVLLRSSDKVNLLEVIEAVEGPIDPFKDPCPRFRTCPVHDVLKEGFKRFISVLHKNSLLQLLERRKRFEMRLMRLRVEVKEQVNHDKKSLFILVTIYSLLNFLAPFNKGDGVDCLCGGHTRKVQAGQDP